MDNCDKFLILGLKPDSIISVSEWADENRILPVKISLLIFYKEKGGTLSTEYSGEQ